MNTDLKYVIDEMDGFMLFPPYVQHDDAARQLTNAGYCSIVGAGFVSFLAGKVCCYGKSTSLRIESRNNFDSAVIAEKLGMQVED